MEFHSVHLIARTLQAANIRYLVVGGLAVNAHGYQRFTSDLDLVIHLTPENIQRALESFASIGYFPSIPITPAQFSDPENRRRWREEKNMLVLNLFNERHRRTPIDIFVTEPFNFETESQNALELPIDDITSIPIVSLPTLLEMKKAAGRSKDLLDIEYLNRLHDFLKNDA
ncbi:MAG: hypothetical protein RLZZ505_895 [Verrucomicrobiota bacterium]|jgi:hypothetical protein